MPIAKPKKEVLENGAILYYGSNKRVSNVEADALITDPPYGVSNNCDYTRFTKVLSPGKLNNFRKGIRGDDRPFDPTPYLEYPKVVLFGYQYFSNILPSGTVLVWLKKRDQELGTFLSDAELAWQKGGKGVYVYRHVWHGFDREGRERFDGTFHPSQKPELLMMWIIGRLGLPKGSVIYDPEIEREYFTVAKQRIEAVSKSRRYIRKFRKDQQA